jgi:hypothetical protein
LRSITDCTPRVYFCVPFSNAELNLSPARVKKCATFGNLRSPQLFSVLPSASFFFCLSRVAVSAGLRIRATSTDSTIAETIVSENWR